MPIIPPTAPGRWLLAWQQRLGHFVRSRVAGEDADERAYDIWGKPGPRWFTPDDPVWRVHEDAAMFAGGVTALLVQSLHPLAMAGVAGHSGYRSDPWGRLQRTSHYIAITTYGTIPDAEETIAHVRSVHERIRGKDYRGRPYAASDPHLLGWVHAAEIWSFLEAYRTFGARPITAADADTYVSQAGHAARLLGVEEPPASVAELNATIERYRPELESSPPASDAAAFLLREPPLKGVARAGYSALSAGAVALVPEWAREMLDIAVPPAALARGRFAVSSVRWGLAGLADARRSRPPE